MTRFSISISAVLAAFALLLLGFTPGARADTYTIYNLGDANYNNIYGIDTSGQVVVRDNAFCGTPGKSCYTTYANGVAAAFTTADIAPALNYDNGTACSSLPSGFLISKSICNNGRMAFDSSFNPNGVANGLYTGTASDLSFLAYGTGDKVVLNSSGDFAWVSGQQEAIYEAVDTTVPEPSSLLLIGTGVFLFGTALRQKFRSNPRN